MTADLINVRFRIGNLLSVKYNTSGGRLLQEIQAAQEGRFSGTRRSDDNDFLPGSNMHVNIFDNLIVTV